MVRPVALLQGTLRSAQAKKSFYNNSDQDDTRQQPTQQPTVQPTFVVLSQRQAGGPFAWALKLAWGAAETALVVFLASLLGSKIPGLIQRAKTHEILKTPLNKIPAKIWEKIDGTFKGLVDLADPNNIKINGKVFSPETTLEEAIHSLIDPKTYPDLINQLKAMFLGDMDLQSQSNGSVPNSSKVNSNKSKNNYLGLAASVDSYTKALELAKSNGSIDEQATAYLALGNHILGEVQTGKVSTSQVALLMKRFSSAGNAEQQLEEAKTFIQSNNSSERTLDTLLEYARSISDSLRQLGHTNGERIPYHEPVAVTVT